MHGASLLPGATADAIRSAFSLFDSRGELKAPPASTLWIAYVRKSVDDGNGNLSLQDQEDMIREWAAARDLSIHRIFREVASGGLSKDSGKRPELQNALRLLHGSPNVAGLVVARLDRLGRMSADVLQDVRDVEHARKSFACAMQQQLVFGPYAPPEARMVAWMLLQMHSLVAQMELEQVSVVEARC